MIDKTTRNLVFTALFAALSCVATMVIRIPTPLGGYINAGDMVVLLGAFLLGPWYGAAAAGLGSALADIISGYVIYAPGTFVIKALIALVAALVLRSKAIKSDKLKALVGGILGEAIMVVGYLGYEALILGFGWAAAANVPMNLIQAVFAVVAGALLFLAIRKTDYFGKSDYNDRGD